MYYCIILFLIYNEFYICEDMMIFIFTLKKKKKESVLYKNDSINRKYNYFRNILNKSEFIPQNKKLRITNPAYRISITYCISNLLSNALIFIYAISCNKKQQFYIITLERRKITIVSMNFFTKRKKVASIRQLIYISTIILFHLILKIFLYSYKNCSMH